MTNSDLRERAERIAKLTETVDEAKEDLRAAYDAAASAGYSKAALRRAIKVHTMPADKRAKFDTAQDDFELYLARLDGRETFAEAAE